MANSNKPNELSYKNQILKSGWILKKSKHIKNYRKRWMLLKGYKLLCYKTRKFQQTKESPTEVFDLSLHRYRVVKHETVKQKFYLIDETMTHSRTFKAFSEVDRDQWVYKINDSITISREMSFDKLYVKVSEKNSTRSTGFSLSATFESEIGSKTIRDLHDSESEESDNDFGGYIVSILKNGQNMDNNNKNASVSINISQATKPQQPQRRPVQARKATISKRKEEHEITQQSFYNFRVESLTIDGDIPDFSDESDEDESKLVPLVEESEEYDEFSEIEINLNLNIKAENELIQADKIEEKAIIEQLKVFGYETNEIMGAMNKVIDSKNINEIRDKLDENKNIKTSETEMKTTPSDVNININIKDSNVNNIILQTEKKEKEKENENEIKSESQAIMQDKQNKNRTFIEQQIITTEQTYFQGLDTLLNELIRPMFDRGLVEQTYSKQIFSSLPKILKFHRSFLNEMNQVYNNKNKNKNMNKINYKSVVNVFNDYIMQHKQEFIDINIKYICDYQTICGHFGFTFHGNLPLDAFLKNKRKEMKPLSSLLMLPVQRIPRYIYLLNHLRKNTEENSDDFKDINDAFEMMQGITKEINERKQNIENLAQCLQIQEGLNGLKAPIIKKERRFIEQFIFIKKEIKHQRLFFLFNDILLIANEKWKVKHILEVYTLDVKMGKKLKKKNMNSKSKKKSMLPEFTLVSTGCGSAVYIGEDIKTINKFKKLIGKWRLLLMSDELRERNNTLGSLKNELGRQALLYD